MDQFEDYLPKSQEKKKIPYDFEPISRNQSPRHVKSITATQPARLVYFVVAILFIATAVLAGFVVKFGKTVANMPSNYHANYLINTTTSEVASSVRPTQTAVDKAIRSVVAIQCDIPAVSENSLGAGVIVNISEDYVYVYTNYHVVYVGGTTVISPIIQLYLYGDANQDHPIVATYVGGTEFYDVAVLKFSVATYQTLLNQYQPLPAVIASSSKVRAGANVFAIGNPDGLNTRVCDGVVASPFDCVIVNVTGKTYSNHETDLPALRCFGLSAPINGGNSGGGLFDTNGNLVGIVNAKLGFKTDNYGNVINYSESLAYALHIDTVDAVACNIVRNDGVFKRCFAQAEITYDTRLDVSNGTRIVYDVIIDKNTTKFNAGDIIKSVTFSKQGLGDPVTMTIDSPYAIEEALLWCDDNAMVTFNVERSSGGSMIEKSIQVNVQYQAITYTSGYNTARAYLNALLKI